MLKRVFKNLDRWRHLPAYQLERRADIFFSLYLKDVVEDLVGTSLEDIIIPELPLKRDIIWPQSASNQSVKVDYALFSRDRSVVYFVELKTDAGSRRDNQDHYLERAAELGFAPFVEGIRQILLYTTAHQKYHHLARTLGELGFLELPDGLEELVYPQPQRGLTKMLEQIMATALQPRIEVIYLQPEQTPGCLCIDFGRFASHVEKHEDDLSRLFASYLRRWTLPAGSLVER